MVVVKRRKYMNQWVVLNMNGNVIRARIIDIQFHQDLGKPIFYLISQKGNDFCLTREELELYEYR